ncbi:hypothetical protein [Nostoc commune]|uniref:hypothetical protein n=1 Tax=Nostoc commune TaxID=1178 RepID=UPI0018C6804A|nr:hypothetical protein [Nostoc commune]MBG1263081.1 hypothetical protein [Nostoc commune BAE]
MTYRDQLRPWAIFQQLPSGQNNCVARLKTRTDADAYASLLRQGGGKFEVAFDQVEQVTQG